MKRTIATAALLLGVSPWTTAGAVEEGEQEYADAEVLELGGRIGLLWTEDLFRFEASPTVGYFVTDAVEISAFFVAAYVNEEDDDGDRETTESYAFIVEPSYHVELREALYLFGGFGVGVGHDGDNFDFEMIPRVGLNIGLTRTGVLTPAVRVPILIDADGTTAGIGFDAAYTVAF